MSGVCRANARVQHSGCEHAYDDHIYMVRSFHGAAAPGVLLGRICHR
ncbi:MAG: hypothetical protein R6V55_08810 [Desulfovermiculus sp.]